MNGTLATQNNFFMLMIFETSLYKSLILMETAFKN